jgi:tungstate transport system permease protein
MTTAVALETSKGNLWLAVNLGVLLMIIVVLVNVLAGLVRRAGERLAA